MASGTITVGRARLKLKFNSAVEYKQYQHQLQAIRLKYGDTHKGEQLIQQLNVRTRQRQKNIPRVVIKPGDYVVNASGARLEVTEVLGRKQGLSVTRVSPKELRDIGKPHKRTHLEIFHVNKEKARVKRILAGLVVHMEAVRWMSTPNSMLDNLTPSEMIETGQSQRVVDLLTGVAEGVYV